MVCSVDTNYYDINLGSIQLIMPGVTKKDLIVFTLITGIFLNTPNAKQFVPNWLQQINSISEYVSQIIDKDDFTETDTGEREEWMILADLKFNGNSEAEQPCDSQTDINIAEDRSLYTAEQIGDMPHWIDQQKKNCFTGKKCESSVS